MDFLSKILKFYNLDVVDYIELSKKVTVEGVPHLSSFNNGQICLDCLKKHIENNSKIIVFGDYDCDGMMATSIMRIAFKKINYTNAAFYIPNRYLEGYGLTVESVKKAISKGFNLIICVDNGISQFEAIDLARENGIDIIICDHHEIKDELPNTPYIIHPELSNLKSYCSGGYTSFVLAETLIGYFDDYMFVLAGISIISDLMVLQNENRNIVKYALDILKRKRFKQIDLLAEDNRIDEHIISNLIAPKINSMGRMLEDQNVNLIVKYFASENIQDILKLHHYIESVNLERKNLANTYQFNKDSYEGKSVVIEVLDVKEGLIGLFANKLLDLSNRPAIVFAKTIQEGVLKGSIRSRYGINVLDLFNVAKEYLIAYGGHDCAAGFSIYEKDLEKFSETIINYCKDKQFLEKNQEVIDIRFADITLENLEILENFGPFGNGNKAPDFRIQNFPTKSFNYSFDRKHIITKISLNSTILCFNVDFDKLNSKFVDFEGVFKANYYKNRKNANFIIKKISSKD